METMDWLDYVRSEKKKPFNEAKFVCKFGTDVIFKDGFDQDVMFDLLSLDPNEDTLPQFSNDPETIVKQIVAHTLMVRRLAAYRTELEKNYGMIAPRLAEQLSAACSRNPMELFECDKLIKQIRDYATSIVQRELHEEELMDSKRIEDELNSL